MKAILTILCEALLQIAMSVMSKEQINDIMKEVAQDWIKKHITVDEIKGEISDLGKFLKEKF